MSGLRVLITNLTLATRTGTETYVRDLALGLARRGHRPVLYSTDLGEIAREIEAGTVPVIDDLRRLATPPDVIHGHHFPETLTALLHFPGVPALHFCHDWAAWHDTPLQHPRVRRYVAVDDTCRDRLLDRHAIPAEQVRVVLNAVDLQRFPPRGPLPERPRRALVFSNQATEDDYLGAVRSACESASLTLDVLGSGAGTCAAQPGDVLGNYDLVFAKGRCALEAMAVGAAVVLCDAGGAGPLVTAADFDRLRRWNFGRRALRDSVRHEVLSRQIARYDAGDVAQVARRVRGEAALDGALGQLVQLYREVIEEQRRAGMGDVRAEGRAAAEGLRWLMPYVREIRSCHEQFAGVKREYDRLRTQRDSLVADRAAVCGELVRSALRETQTARQIEGLHQELALQQARAGVPHDWQGQYGKAVQDAAALKAECERLHTLLAGVQGSATVRLRNRLRRVPLVARLTRLARRALTR